jgi:F-type H+-transporting ATPase subunit a
MTDLGIKRSLLTGYLSRITTVASGFPLLFSVATAAESAHAAEGLPPAAPVLFQVGPLPVNNSMVLSWVVAALVIFVARRAAANIKEVPEGLQNVVEWVVESLRDFLEGIMGRVLTAKTFWFFATAFVFILSTNWFGLLPGVGTVGWGIPDEHGHLHHLSHPLLRGANADLNLTLAMSVVFFASWLYWALKENGVGGFLHHIFAPRGESKGVLKLLMVVVFFCVGILELVSILFRPVSLSFRLYGNIFAGETMLEAMSNLVPALAPLIPIPFYFLELLVGMVQALVFTLLTAVFTLLICSHAEGHEGHEGGDHH